jgi:MMPL family
VQWVDRGFDPTEEAVAHGIKATAGVVTSAAIAMVAVFAIFATLAMIDFKMMGVGLAVAVLLDASIVRAILLPSAMKLLAAAVGDETAGRLELVPAPVARVAAGVPDRCAYRGLGGADRRAGSLRFGSLRFGSWRVDGSSPWAPFAW